MLGITNPSQVIKCEFAALRKNEGLIYLQQNWTPSFAYPLVELIRLSTDQKLIEEATKLLRDKTGKNLGPDFYAWIQWLWTESIGVPTYYADFKAKLYQHIDPKFATYFLRRQHTATIRIDEILWGGVKQDGIPPLRMPSMSTAPEAAYLADSDLVFGVFLNGVAKAYPKRILAWHELFVDSFGDQHIAGVYCTLCGTVIAYDMTHNGVFYDLGTSGFLYRSNKLMYDRATHSLWNTIEGKPVMGPLNNKNITLQSYPVVTTTWGEWKSSHPDTKVLSLQTGHERNYGEGVAYARYFSTDDLMFPVPKRDNRLANKAEVLIIRAENYQQDPLAISIDYLTRKRIHYDRIADTDLVVLTTKNGTSRAYHRPDIAFDSYKKGILTDEEGQTWNITEDALIHPEGHTFERLPAHRIFWFAWFNTYPMTRLVK